MDAKKCKFGIMLSVAVVKCGGYSLCRGNNESEDETVIVSGRRGVDRD